MKSNNNHSGKSFYAFTSAALALVLMVVASVALIQHDSTAGAESVTLTENATVVTSPFTEAVEKVRGSVVGVNNYTTYRNSYYGFGFGYGYGGGYNDDDTSRQVLQGSGSGVVVYVEDLDIEPVVLGDSDQLSVGDWAICIGNPLSFTGTTTVGVISALNREVTSSATDAYGKRAVNTMIQTDAAINAGNSGGGMFNVAGELIGIPSMKYTGSMFTGSTVEGIGMAIPINEAKDLINDVLSGNGNVEGSTSNSTQGSASISTGDKPRIGVTVSNLNPNSYAVANNLIPTGAYVQNVESGSPAEKAGVQVADIVVEVDGTRVSSMEEMTSILQSKQAGDTATLKVYRVEGGLDSYEDQTSIPDGEYIDLTVELAMLDAAAQ